MEISDVKARMGLVLYGMGIAYLGATVDGPYTPVMAAMFVGGIVATFIGAHYVGLYIEQAVCKCKGRRKS